MPGSALGKSPWLEPPCAVEVCLSVPAASPPPPQRGGLSPFQRRDFQLFPLITDGGGGGPQLDPPLDPFPFLGLILAPSKPCLATVWRGSSRLSPFVVKCESLASGFRWLFPPSLLIGRKPSAPSSPSPGEAAAFHTACRAPPPPPGSLCQRVPFWNSRIAELEGPSRASSQPRLK